MNGSEEKIHDGKPRSEQSVKNTICSDPVRVLFGSCSCFVRIYPNKVRRTSEGGTKKVRRKQVAGREHCRGWLRPGHWVDEKCFAITRVAQIFNQVTYWNQVGRPAPDGCQQVQ